MAKTFTCPFCEASYSALPTLVGRKVRCSSCKNVFQLQHTGIAIKIETAVAKKAPNQEKPSKKTQPGANSPSASSAPLKTRPQTVAIRKQTKRIQKMRTSLQDMANKALDDIDKKSQNDALEPKDGNSKKNLSQKKEIQDSHRVVLSGGGKNEHKLRRIWIISAIAIPFFLILYMFSGSQTAIEQAFSDFTKPAQAANRLEVFHHRMWRNQRLKTNDISVIRTLDEVRYGKPFSYEWIHVTSFLQKTIHGMEEHSLFPIWIHAADKNKIDELWDKHPDKGNIGSFYHILPENNISIIQMATLDRLIRSEGIPVNIAYTLSMLLIPGLPADTSEMLFGNESPTHISVLEFTGKHGAELVSSGKAYDIASVPEYCGLLVGFTGIDGSQDIVWRILDIRKTATMESHYAVGNNPLYKYAQEKKRKALLSIHKDLEKARAENAEYGP